MNHASGRHGAATTSERSPAVTRRGRLRRAALRAIPVLLIVAIPMAVTIAPVHAGTGGTSETTGTAGGDRYDRLWRGLSRKQKRWARRTSECESGGQAKIHGGGGTYHGAFQFRLSTWRTSPKSPGGDPHRYRWRVQAVVAVYLKKRDGAGHWPNCG
jgi:hypothetical protein